MNNAQTNIKASILIKMARSVLTNPDNWGKKAYAYDRLGLIVEPTYDTACKFCSAGALYKSLDILNISVWDFYFVAREYLDKSVPKESIASEGVVPDIIVYNDLPTTTHADILSLFDRAIQLAESEGN